MPPLRRCVRKPVRRIVRTDRSGYTKQHLTAWLITGCRVHEPHSGYGCQRPNWERTRRRAAPPPWARPGGGARPHPAVVAKRTARGRPLRDRGRPQPRCHRGGHPQPRGVGRLPPRQPAFRLRREEARPDLGGESRRTQERPRPGPPALPPRLLALVHRRLRPVDAPREHPAAHRLRSVHDVRRHEAKRRASLPVLPPPLRHRRAQPALSRTHQLQNAAGRRNDRLRGRHVLRCGRRRPLHLLRAAGPPT